MKKTRIMIAEDEGLIAQRIKISLERMGCEVVAAASRGEEAMEKAVDLKPDLIMMDIMIKGEMDGIETAIQIREKYDIPVIYLTAYGDNKTLERAKASKPVGYILKPINDLQMQAAIEIGLHIHQTEQKLKVSESALQEERALLSKRIEERTRELSLANAELSRASRLKDEFLANMSHELRTPLTVILGIAEIFYEQIYGTLNEEQLGQMQMLVKSSRELLTLVNNILDISRIEAGSLKLSPQIVQLDKICRDAVKEVTPLADPKDIEIIYAPASSATQIQVDRNRLKQIMVNLLENAVKFSPNRGRVDFKVEEYSAEGYIQFSVSDQGAGISEKNLTRIFKPFAQVDSSFTRKHGGAGLGLVLVYRLSEMQGGGLTVKSELGRGSCFSVRLPWKNGHAAEFADAPVDPSNTNPNASMPLQTEPLEILLAEDNEKTICLISDHFALSHGHVTVARNGAEAVRYFREKQPDIIIMDLQMPVMNGLEAIKQIRYREKNKNHHFKRIPIIVMSALITPGQRQKCLAGGADEYLPKPFRLDALQKIMSNCLKAS